MDLNIWNSRTTVDIITITPITIADCDSLSLCQIKRMCSIVICPIYLSNTNVGPDKHFPTLPLFYFSSFVFLFLLHSERNTKTEKNAIALPAKYLTSYHGDMHSTIKLFTTRSRFWEGCKIDFLA